MKESKKSRITLTVRNEWSVVEDRLNATYTITKDIISESRLLEKILVGVKVDRINIHLHHDNFTDFGEFRDFRDSGVFRDEYIKEMVTTRYRFNNCPLNLRTMDYVADATADNITSWFGLKETKIKDIYVERVDVFEALEERLKKGDIPREALADLLAVKIPSFK